MGIKFEKTLEELRALSRQHHMLPSLAESKCKLLKQENDDLRDLLIKKSESEIVQKKSQSFEKIEQLQAKCFKLKEENQSLQMQLLEKEPPNEKMIQHLTDQCNALRKEKEDILEEKEKNEEAHSTLRSQATEMEGKCKQLEEQNLRLKKLLSAKENELAEVKKDIITANKTNLKETKTVDEQKVKIQELKSEINDFIDQLNAAHSKNMCLKETNISLKNKISMLELEINNYESLYSESTPDNLQSKYAEAMEHIKTLSDELTGFDEIKIEKERLSTEVQSLTQKLEELQSLASEHKMLESEHNILKNNYRTALSVHHREKNEMKEEIEILYQKMENYETSYQELIERYSEMVQACSFLQKNGSVNNALQTNYNQKINVLTQKYEAMVESRKQISKEKLQLEMIVNELNEEAKQHQSSTSDDTSTWQKKAKKYDDKLKELKELWDADKSKLNSLQTKYNQLERKVQEYEARMGMYKKLDDSLKDKSDEISALKKMLKQAKTRYKNSKGT